MKKVLDFAPSCYILGASLRQGQPVYSSQGSGSCLGGKNPANDPLSKFEIVSFAGDEAWRKR